MWLVSLKIGETGNESTVKSRDSLNFLICGALSLAQIHAAHCGRMVIDISRRHAMTIVGSPSADFPAVALGQQKLTVNSVGQPSSIPHISSLEGKKSSTSEMERFSRPLNRPELHGMATPLNRRLRMGGRRLPGNISASPAVWTQHFIHLISTVSKEGAARWVRDRSSPLVCKATEAERQRSMWRMTSLKRAFRAF